MVIFLLLTILLIAGAVGVAILSSLTGRTNVARGMFAVVVVCLCAYFGAIAWFSTKSEPGIIETGKEKRLHGVELDAHFIYSVKAFERTGERCRIVMHVRSDAGAAHLTVPPLLLTLVGGDGRDTVRTEFEPPKTKIAPEEGRDFEVNLNCPQGSSESYLRIEHADPFERFISHFIIDSELSFGHQKSLFQLPNLHVSANGQEKK